MGRLFLPLVRKREVVKSIVAVLSLLVGCSAAAQSVKPAMPDAAVIEPELIPMEKINVSGFETYTASRTTAVAASLIPDSPHPMPVPASIQAARIPNSRSAEFKTFRSSKFNRSMVVTEFWARGLDAASTYNKLNDPCGCYHEASRFFGLDMAPVFKSEAGAYAYSLGVAAAYSFASAKLWNAGKQHPRHARLLQRLSRSLLIVDSSMEIAVDIHNLNLMKQQPLVK